MINTINIHRIAFYISIGYLLIFEKQIFKKKIFLTTFNNSIIKK